MKNLTVPTMLAVMLAMSHSASAAAPAQLRQYAALSSAADDNGTGEVDHNADALAPGDSSNEMIYDEPGVHPTEAPPVPKLQPKPIVKSPMAKKDASAADVPTPHAKAKKNPAARDIPLIETENATESSPDVNYVTGGIGEDERQSIESAKGDYNLHVMSASINGAFVGDARVVVVSKADNKEMLNVVAGPLLYVKLPEGKYALDATLGEQKKHQDFTIGGKTPSANVHLGWKVDATVTDK